MEKDIFNINKNQLSYGRGYVYSLQYHLVWCTKYRKKVLKDGIDLECKKMLQDLAEEYRFQILAMEVMPDHIHMLVDCRPQFYISDMIKIMKGNLARQMFLLHPELKKELWKKKRESPEYRNHSRNVCFCGKGGRRCGQYPAMVWRYENRISRSVRQWRSIVRQSVT
ncbi:MAG: IS200/IS605 family transposase [Ruminococcus sp.]|nr:IS200/IS605 family transposase [Ruminococcus sp.]